MSSAGSVAESQIEGKNFANSIAMMISLISFTMLFAVLFLGYAVFRFNALEWPPMGMERVDLFIPSMSTLVIMLSSLTFWSVGNFISGAQKKKAELMGSLSLLLGALFVGTQFILWETLRSKGIYQGTGIYASLIYGFTWTHVGHMVLAIALKAWLILMVFRAKEVRDIGQNLVRNVSMFWHFLGIVWVLIYVVLFVL